MLVADFLARLELFHRDCEWRHGVHKPVPGCAGAIMQVQIAVIPDFEQGIESRFFCGFYQLHPSFSKC